MPRPPLPLTEPPRRILLVKPSAIGDIIHALPTLHVLAKTFPKARISWVVNSAFADLLQGHPLLDEVIGFDRGSFSPVRFRKFARSLRQRGFDLAIDLQGLLRSGYITWKSAAPVRIGFASAREMAPVFYTHRVPADRLAEHAVDRCLKIAQALGCPSGPVEFPLPITSDDRAALDRLLEASPNRDSPVAVLLPGSIWPTKRWPIENFAELARLLRERLGLQSVVAGSRTDSPLAAQIPALNLTGRTSLRQLVALLQRARLVVSGDSGPMHIAAALGTPLVAIYGPTNPASTGPYRRESSVVRLDIPCSPCYSRRCSHQSCLQWLRVDQVFALAEQQLTSLSGIRA